MSPSWHRYFLGLAALPLIAGCGGGSGGSGSPAPTATGTPTPAPAPAPSPTPTPTPTPTPAPGTYGAFANPDNGAVPDASTHPIAFPTAIGFGRVASVRSSNAVVYKINSLEDSANPSDGKITYRECALALQVTSPYAIPAGRPRYCLFDVSGAISLQSPAWITTPRIYIAGQSSPGGIEFRLGANYSPVDSLIDTRRGGDHMILRHVRVRTGEHPNRPSTNGDPIRTNATSAQIIDHVSAMFGTDESLELSSCNNCTVQWSIIGPNICRNAGHTSALHCKTFFLKPANNVTVAYNLSQHGEQRGLNIAPGTNPPAAGATAQADIFNNVIYHITQENGLLSDQFASPFVNYIGNVNFRGPQYTPPNENYFVTLYSETTSFPRGFSVYMKDNVTMRNRIAGQFGQNTTDPFRNAAGFFSGTSASSVCGVTAAGAQNCSVTGLNVIQDQAPVLAPGLSGLQYQPWMLSSPMQAMRNVLAFAGAERCREGSCRDNVDAMYIDDVRTCDQAPFMFQTGWTSTVAASGGFAQLVSTGGSKTDTDNDGMPDDWENQFQNTNAAVWDANADADGDGYPNIEEYLSHLARDDERYRNIYMAGTGALPQYNCGRPML
ncbi:MAG: hypothetical protein WBH10_05625 [Allopontixanthobacter sediminis]